MYTIFYSWQAVLPNKTNRGFIERSIEKAINELRRSDEYFLELTLDRDILNTDGSPDIANTLFQKIRESHLFIADVSIINSESSTRKMPNPNVLIELGYAASGLGWESIICLFNTKYGKVEELPFDLRARSIITYYADEEVENTPEKEKLSKTLKNIIEGVNYDRLKELKLLERLVKPITPLAYRIAISKADNWNNRFFEELYRTMLVDIVNKYEDYKQELIYRKRIKLDYNEYFTWIIHQFEEIQIIITKLGKFFETKIFAAINEGKSIEIYNMVNQLFQLVNEILEWEIYMYFTATPEEFKDLYKLCLGGSGQVIDFLENVIVQFHKAYTKQPFKKIDKFPKIFDTDAFIAETTRLRKEIRKGNFAE